MGISTGLFNVDERSAVPELDQTIELAGYGLHVREHY